MPMFDFICKVCGTAFEELVTNGAAFVCPQCGAGAVERQMSAPSPVKKGVFPYKPGPVRPLGAGLPACGAGGCGMRAGCGFSCGEQK
ncbi:FmdB family zinc ribbon protein [Candidatus Desulfovibrio trichonymphae]|uniref:FmdB family regulatory protein n=1 Tax=Candidatus Desulfovibrio trichonymphae TaxID=1725232 RepID=A0A1J1DYJ3_9BACT|nr:zinc ribbon domain-containing protein [Candidatus Desulfovibrio trichonymphae]BAV92182.1 FmdB family regulatory protein [Candidatus Desulfovibrio trichonymphae]GHU92600.1 hypothetical protein AGMMS49925_11430 [Deltaproteobacteria bacterium]GHU96476.1 hypothetical protein AGMMS49974_10710 [Deltaproteobacteria bacterium]GHU98909.1 hypothetical protein AGMMS50248_06230 [Deltaproteobacteria bacterium]